MEEATLKRIRDALSRAKRVAFLGGAGVSVASGIPDFRSPGGLYSQKRADGRSYEELLSSDYFFEDPKGFYDFYWSGMVNTSAKPNKAHLALAAYEHSGHDIAVLTQNIDGLHQIAGSKKVYELHGSVQRYHCLKCHSPFGLEDITPSGVPICPRCGGMLKPDVVLYGESLPYDDLTAGINYVHSADVLIVGGTSLRVYPVASIPGYFRGRLSVLINAEPTPYDDEFDIVLHDDIGEALEEILR